MVVDTFTRGPLSLALPYINYLTMFFLYYLAVSRHIRGCIQREETVICFGAEEPRGRKTAKFRQTGLECRQT